MNKISLLLLLTVFIIVITFSSQPELAYTVINKVENEVRKITTKPDCSSPDAIEIVKEIAKDHKYLKQDLYSVFVYGNDFMYGNERYNEILKEKSEEIREGTPIDKFGIAANKIKDEFNEKFDNSQYEIRDITFTGRDETTQAVECKAFIELDLGMYGKTISKNQYKYKIEKTTEGKLIGTVYPPSIFN